MYFFLTSHWALLALALTVCASAPPQFIILQTKVQPGQTGKSAFNGLYLTLDEIGDYSDQSTTTLYPTLNKLNSAAVVWVLVPGATASNGDPALYYLNYNGTSYSENSQYSTVMNFNFAPYALWQQAQLPSPKINNFPTSLQNRFYIDTTTSPNQLLWNNNLKNVTFESWLVCDWYYGVPQLFFTVKTQQDFEVPAHAKLPSSCALVALDIVPLPN